MDEKKRIEDLLGVKVLVRESMPVNEALLINEKGAIEDLQKGSEKSDNIALIINEDQSFVNLVEWYRDKITKILSGKSTVMEEWRNKGMRKSLEKKKILRLERIPGEGSRWHVTDQVKEVLGIE